MMMQSKPKAVDATVLDSRSRTYMIGHQTMSKKELQAALVEAQQDPELKGTLRNMVIERYKLRIAGGHF
jgi:hypothetical protein